MFIADLIRQWTTEMVITNKRIVVKTGLIRRETFDNRLAKVEGVSVEQGIIGRIFGYGSVTVRGVGIGSLTIPGIANAQGFKNAFNQACDEAETK